MASSSSDDLLTFTPLGAGQEVGRSCHYLEFKGKKIMLDCGIHPGMNGVDALPFMDFIDCSELDIVLITHFHLDHCGALPWLLEKTEFRGKCFMTHATKSIYRLLIGDFIKIAKYRGGRESGILYTEEDLERSMEKIEVIDFHEQKEVNGIKFHCYVAGHVLGAAMFMIEIAGIKVLYTGDFSCSEDRHLCSAEVPRITPDILISESTYGTQVHESREEREKRFTSTVHEIVSRGGRCLIPAFALGRAQELLLILDEYWENHPELHDIPIYYASALAKKCMAVYQTFVSGMNQRIKRQIATSNPFVFKHVSNLKGIDHFDDVGPCVVLASPGMLQSGLSRELFENWCPDSKNGCIIAGYCVEGTLAKHILSEPEEIVTLNGQKLPMRLQVAYISFSAHTDYLQTSDFVRALKPPHLILVHGEMNEMNRLKAAILRQYEDDNDYNIEVHNPRNTESIHLRFRGQKTAKVVGTLAMTPPEDNSVISGILIRRNFNYHLLHPNDLSAYTDLSNSRLTQRMSVFYDQSMAVLKYNLEQLSYEVESLDPPKSTDQNAPTHILKMFKGEITLFIHEQKQCVFIDWNSNPTNDMYADAVLSAILHAQGNPVLEKHIPQTYGFFCCESSDKEHKNANPHDNARIKAIRDTVTDLCGEDAIITEEGEMINVELNEKTAQINTTTMHIICTDALLQHLLSSVATKVSNVMMPI